MDEPRPLTVLREYSQAYPRAWKQAAQMRSDRGKSLPDWPEWCYLPVSGTYSIVDAARGPIVGPEGEANVSVLWDVPAVAALAAWRMAKGVYRFDETVFRTLWDTPVSGNLPTDVLYRLPEWCPYIEAPPGGEGEGEEMLGFFAHLEHDVESARPELRLLMDLGEQGLAPLILHLDRATLPECIEGAIQESRRQAGRVGAEGTPEGSEEELRELVEPLLSVTLYLCSVSAEIRPADGDPGQRPANPTAKKTRKGEKLFAATQPAEWAVGWRMGAALRRAWAQTADAGQGSGRSGPRPHVRRAHWATYWTGPRSGEQTPILKWLPPIAVNIEDLEEMPATVRRVEP